jgi:FAD:protein FMN transferase
VTAAVLGRAVFRSLGTTAELLTTDADRIDAGTSLLAEELAEIDLACSRFRPDSEISVLHERSGRAVRVSALLAQALGVSLAAARLTDGLVDPTIGAAVSELGYDADFAEIDHDSPLAPRAAVAAPGWWRVALDETERFVLLPRGVRLDLGATAKALAADRAAARLAAELDCGVLVSLGGDIAVAGPAPEGGWTVRVCEDHAAAPEEGGPLVTIESGGLATSSTVVRAWRRGGVEVHHIIDPRTGSAAAPVWRAVTVAAASCIDANTASTAAVVLGHAAPAWLAGRGLPARLAGADQQVVTVGGWPADELGQAR